MASTVGDRLDPWLDSYAAQARSMTASQIRALFAVASRPEVVSLAGGMPAISALDLDDVAGLVAQVVAAQGGAALQYGSGQGDVALRELIASAVLPPVGVSAHPDDIVVTVGSQHALELVTAVFCDPGDVVLVESPSYVGALSVFAAAQVRVVHLPMDDDGLVADAIAPAVAALAAQGRRVKMLYTVPSFHNPAGVTQPPQRRAAVLAAAQRAGVLVLEDDPYALLGFDEVVPRALRADDPTGVVYLGSFSKTFAPGLRVGFAVAPHGVREKLVLASEASVLCPSALAQLTIAAYLTHRPWWEQVKAFRELYRERRDALLDAMTALLPAATTWTRPSGGFYSWVTLPGGLDATAMLPRAVTARVAYVPGSAFYAPADADAGRSSLRLSYCHPTPDRIREGVRRLASVVGDELALADTFGTAAAGLRPAGPGPDVA